MPSPASAPFHFHPAPKLPNRSVLVTGASRGIGLAIAYAFGAHGAKSIVLVGRHEAGLVAAAEVVAKAKGWCCGEEEQEQQRQAVRVKVKVGDVRDREFWVGLRGELADIDILVNAAGVVQSSLLISSPAEHVENVVRTNLMGTMWGCQVMAKAMVRQKRASHDSACIINVASLLAVKGGLGATAYAASKAGVLGLTRSLALELGSANIRVNAIVPGYIETAMTEGMTPEARAQALKQIPQRRFGTVDEVADAAVFLAANQYANNCVLNLDGGLSAT